MNRPVESDPVQVVRDSGLSCPARPAQSGQYQRNYGTKYGTEPFSVEEVTRPGRADR